MQRHGLCCVGLLPATSSLLSVVAGVFESGRSQGAGGWRVAARCGEQCRKQPPLFAATPLSRPKCCNQASNAAEQHMCCATLRNGLRRRLGARVARVASVDLAGIGT
eukprot:3182032-Alexandrium_andersonii.AAC.1